MKRLITTIFSVIVAIIIVWVTWSYVVPQDASDCWCDGVDVVDGGSEFKRTWFGSGLYGVSVSYSYEGDGGWYIFWMKDSDRDVPFGQQCGLRSTPDYDPYMCQVADLTDNPDGPGIEWLRQTIGDYYREKGVVGEARMILDCACCWERFQEK